MRRAAWAFVAAFGRVGADRAALIEAAARLARRPVDARTLADCVNWSKVEDIVAANIDRIGRPDALTPVAGVLRERIERRRPVIAARDELATPVLELAVEHGGRVIKGRAMRAAYPVDAPRHVGDVDLHFERIADAMALCARLRHDGWTWDTRELPWLKWDPDSGLYGQLKIRRSIGIDDTTLRADIHVGPFSVGHLGRMPLGAFEPAVVEGVPAMVPSPATALAIVAAHAAGDAYLSMKDVNDAALVAAQDDVRPWADAQSIAAAARIEPVLEQVRRAVGGTFARRPLPLGDVGRIGRARRTLRLTYRQSRAESGRRAALTRLPAALRYYLGDLRPRAAEGSGPTALEADHRNPWTCWRLLPEPVWRPMWPNAEERPPHARAERLAPSVDVHNGADGSCAMVVAGDVMVPTVWGRIPRSSVRLARTLDRLDD